MLRFPIWTLLFACGGLCAATPEWAQWAGPNRNFQVADRLIAEEWPETGPPIVWKRALGYGGSSGVVDGNSLYTMYRDCDSEGVVALDPATGRTPSEYKYPDAFLNTLNIRPVPS